MTDFAWLTRMAPDIENGLIGWLTETFPAVKRVNSEVPADMSAANLPLIQAVRVGGGVRDLTLHSASVSVDVFHVGRDQARKLALQVEAAFLTMLPGSVFAGLVVTHVEEISAPSWRPWSNTNLRRFGATYDVRFKPAV